MQPLTGSTTVSKAEKVKAIRQWMNSAKLDVETTKVTMGASHANSSPELLLQASAKALKVGRKEAEPDDRDNLMFFKAVGYEDRVLEHIVNDAGRHQQKLLRTASNKRSLKNIPSGVLSPQIRSTIIGNPLAQLSEQINPLAVVDESFKISKMGPGGIQSTDSAPDEARWVNPSYFGFFDPIQGPESLQVGLAMKAAHNTAKTKDGKLITLVQDLQKPGKPKVWVDHETIARSVVRIPEF